MKNPSGSDLWNSVRDYFLLCAITGAANAVLAAGDPGWLQLNPSPWLLPAFLIGLRYGFAPGLASGLTTVMLITAANVKFSGAGLEDFLREQSYLLLIVAGVGAAAGEWQAIVSRRSGSLKTSQQRFADENARLKTQLELVKQTRHEIQLQLALYNAPIAALDDDLKELFSFPLEEFPGELLRRLHRLASVTSAAFYLVEGPRLQLFAILHPTPPLANSLVISDTPLAEAALSTNQLASVEDATLLTSLQPYLAAFPWKDHLGRSAVLLIQDMPLEAYTFHHLARIELILTWTSALARLRQSYSSPAGADHTIPREDFPALLSDLIQAALFHGLPSVIVKVTPGSPEGYLAALHSMPNTALTVRLEDGQSLAVLLPFSGVSQAEELAGQLTGIIPGVLTHRYLVTSDATPESLCEKLAQPLSPSAA